MEIEFSDPEYDRLEIDAGFTAGFSAAVIKAYRKRLQWIRGAPDERDFYTMKSLHFEKLKGDRSGQHSMRLNKQWRLILRLEKRASKKLVIVIGIGDYH